MILLENQTFVEFVFSHHNFCEAVIDTKLIIGPTNWRVINFAIFIEELFAPMVISSMVYNLPTAISLDHLSPFGPHNRPLSRGSQQILWSHRSMVQLGVVRLFVTQPLLRSAYRMETYIHASANRYFSLLMLYIHVSSSDHLYYYNI